MQANLGGISKAFWSEVKRASGFPSIKKWGCPFAGGTIILKKYRDHFEERDSDRPLCSRDAEGRKY